MIDPRLIPYLEKMDGWNSLVRWAKKNNAENDLEYHGKKYIKKAQQQYEQDPKAFSDTSLRDTPSANVRFGSDVYGIDENKFKITKEDLQRIIKEELKDLQEDGHEDVSSARRKLKTIIEDASQILQGLDTTQPQELPSWWMSKITICSEYINKARDYFLIDGEPLNEEKKDETNQKTP